MKGMSWIWGALALGGLMACAVPAGPPSTVDAGGVDLSKPAAVIKSLVAGKVDLPKSLQEESSNPVAGSMRQIGRAAGDISTLTSLNLPSLKAEGYLEFKKSVSEGSAVQMFLDALKTSEVIKNETLVPGQTADLGEVALYGGGGILNVKVPNSGKIMTELSSDGQTLYIYWVFSYPDMGRYYSQDPNNRTYETMQDCANDPTARLTIPIYFIVQKSGMTRMWAESVDMGMKFFARYDSSSKESVSAQRTARNGNADEYLKLAQPQADGSVFFYTRSASSGEYNNSSERMGYANDNYGGVVSSGSHNWDGEDHPYINVEYYDGSGDLIYQGWGNSAQNTNDWSWMAASAAYSANLYQVSTTKPSNVALRRKYDYSTSPPINTMEISFDGGAFVAFGPEEETFDGWSLIFHTPDPGDSESSYALQEGDAYYYSIRWDSESLSSNVWQTTVSYYKAIEVPTGETYFGTKYFVSKNYPLKNLLPLSGEYSGYEVRQKEGSTWYSWEDLSGNWRYRTTPPDSDSEPYRPNSLSHWTDYSYWLENKAFVDTDPTTEITNDPNLVETDKGDVWFDNLSNLKVWYWDMAAQKSMSREAPAYRIYSGSDLPPYFSVNTAQIEATGQTKAALETFYAKRITYKVDTYLADFDDVMGSVAGKMPSLD